MIIIKDPNLFDPSYNHRRYSTPWGAWVHFHFHDIRPDYDFVGYWDKANVLIGLKDPTNKLVVAFGQKDRRNAKNTFKQFYLVDPNTGDLTKATEAEARDYYNANHQEFATLDKPLFIGTATVSLTPSDPED